LLVETNKKYKSDKRAAWLPYLSPFTLKAFTLSSLERNNEGNATVLPGEGGANHFLQVVHHVFFAFHCIYQPFGMKNHTLTIKYCRHFKYWKGHVQSCGDTSEMPTIGMGS